MPTLTLSKPLSESANFSIVMPGGCNAKCPFCFWKRSAKESPMFVQQLAWYLDTLGEKVTQISITGGEPTLSSVFDDVILALRQYSTAKIVLTTNGTGILTKIPALEGVVRHLNISRHAIDDAENAGIFGTGSVPTARDLAEICGAANASGIDVTLNRVIPCDYNDPEDLNKYIEFIKNIGASALTLRKDFSTGSLDPTPIEGVLGKARASSSCPVCATNSYIVKGAPINFKSSLKEPSDVLPYVYEMVYHPDGVLTEDWQKRKPIEFMVEQANASCRHTCCRPPPTVNSSGCGVYGMYDR